MKTKIQFFICSIALVIISTSCLNRSNQNSQSSTIESTEPAYEINKEFLQAYLGGNRIAADEKYKDKRFTVRGMVSEITNVYEPIVKVETEVGAVDCIFDESQTSELSKLSIAQKVEIECIFKGILTSARFESCKIIDVQNIN